MSSYKKMLDEIWRQAVTKLVGKRIETEPDVSKSNTDDESDVENVSSNLQPYLESRSSAGNSKHASPPTTYSEQQWELSDEDIERCYQAARDLLQIRMGPFGKPKNAPVNEDEPEIEIKFKLQFLTATESLKITITELKNIGCKHDIEKTSMYVEACLMPGKMLRNKTNVEMGRDSIRFDQVMYFGGFDLDEMHLMTLRLILYSRNAACGRKTSFSRLGDINVSLTDIDITSENCFTEAINTRICFKRGGRGSVRVKMIT